MKPSDKLKKLKDMTEWPIIEDAINDLIENKDLILETHIDCVVSYILKKLKEK